MYAIIAETNGAYNHREFLRDDFMASHYFLLLELMSEHAQMKNDLYEKNKKR